jgi:TonB dependent receptor
LSFYVNDRWQLNNKWTFNLGARWERHTADATQAGIVTPNSSVVVPRLAATFDVAGDGRWILQATYGHYAGKASETQFARDTNVGNPNQVNYLYNGPVGEGVGFAPGFDLSNYSVIGGSFPVRNVFLDPNLKTPVTKEWTLQAGTRLGRKGEVKAVYAHRRTGNLLDDFITDPTASGKTTVTENGRTFGTFDNSFVTNTDISHREYQALELQGGYRFTDKWTVSANYTHQFKNNGNFEGEAGNQPGSFSIIGNRPEFFDPLRAFPDQYQAHRVRAFSTYDFSFGAAGRVSLGLLYRYDSPQVFTYSASSVPLTAIQKAKNPGYATTPATQTLFFGERGTGRFNAQHLLDLALNYEWPIWKTARPYFKVDWRNVFDSQPLIGFNTTISPDPASPTDGLGLATGFIKGPNFGKGVQNSHYPVPRELRLAVGFRF